MDKFRKLGLIEPIIKGITEHAKKEGAKSVSKIILKIGQLTGIKESSFKETFATLAKGTMLENAKLEIILFPGTHVQVVSFEID